MSMLNTWNKNLIKAQAQLEILQQQRDKLEESLKSQQFILETQEGAQSVILAAAQITQQTLSAKLGSVVSSALAAVFPNNPYKFVVNFEQRRNTTECDLLFERNGQTMKPLYDSGLGAADIASTALRISYWSSGESRPILIIDEPCKNLSLTYRAAAAAMFSELCKKLNLQMIVITHIPEFRKGCDRMHLVRMDTEGVSKVIQTMEN